MFEPIYQAPAHLAWDTIAFVKKSYISLITSKDAHKAGYYSNEPRVYCHKNHKYIMIEKTDGRRQRTCLALVFQPK